eukprot:9317873-Alexandrium_andersonii.AAC.1
MPPDSAHKGRSSGFGARCLRTQRTMRSLRFHRTMFRICAQRFRIQRTMQECTPEADPALRRIPRLEVQTPGIQVLRLPVSRA